MQQDTPFFVVAHYHPEAGGAAETSTGQNPEWLAEITELDTFGLGSYVDSRSETINDEIRLCWERAIRDGKHETFHYGMESEFSASLQSIVQKYGSEAVLELGHMLKKGEADPEVAQEALLQLGMIDDGTTHRIRLTVLEESLKADMVEVRDAAGLGIASMDDPSALPSLRHALQRETSIRLRHDLNLVVEQLEQTQQCRDS